MATLQELEQALINADAAGDVQAAKELAAAIIAERGKQTQPEPETTAAGLAGAATRGLAPIVAGGLAGAGVGALAGGVGAIPGFAAGAGAAGLAQMVNSVLGTRHQSPFEALGDLLTRLGVPQADTEAERIVQSIAGGAAGGLGGVAAGQAIKAAAGQAAPTVARIGGAMAAAPAAQVLGGAGAGGAAQTAAEMGTGPVGELAAGLAGGVIGAKAGGPARVPVADPGRAARIAQEAQARGIPVLTSDVAPPQTFIGKAGQQLGERVPLAGTGPVRARQQEARTAAVRDLLTEFGAADAVDMSPNLIKDIGQQRAEQLSKYATLKRDVIGKVSSVGGEVPLTKTMTEIDNQIAALTERRSGPANEAIERLQQIKADLQGRSLNQLEAYRADELAAAFKDDPVRPMTVAARDIGEKALRAIYGPVRQDMGDFIKANGDRRDFEKWMVANKRLSDMSSEVKQGALKSVLQSGNATPEVVNRMLFSAKPSEINQLYGQLSQDGRGMARTAVLRRAADKAMYRTTTGDEMFSPDLFAKEMKRLEPQVGVFFTGADKAQVEGLTRALNLTKRAAEAGVSTASGQQAVPFAIGSLLQALFGTFGAAVAAAGGAGGAARLYESAPVRNLMIQLSRTKPGAKDEAAIFKRISEAIRAEQQAQEPPRLEVLGVADQEQQ